MYANASKPELIAIIDSLERQIKWLKDQNKEILARPAEIQPTCSKCKQLAEPSDNLSKVKGKWDVWNDLVTGVLVSKENIRATNMNSFTRDISGVSFSPQLGRTNQVGSFGFEDQNQDQFKMPEFGTMKGFINGNFGTLNNIRSTLNGMSVLNMTMRRLDIGQSSCTIMEVPEYEPNRLNLIEAICLFGPCREQVRSIEKSVTASELSMQNYVSYEMYYPHELSLDYEIYGHYIFPQDIPIKMIKNKHIDVEADRMIFKTTTKHRDVNLFIFQAQENNPLAGQNTASLVNPSKWLYALSVSFKDYDWLMEASEVKEDPKSYKSEYALCMFTYFPYIDALSELLAAIMNQVKIRRMEKFTKDNNYEHVDIKMVTEEIHSISREILGHIRTINVDDLSIKGSISVSIPCLNYQVGFKKDQLLNDLSQDWICRLLRLFDKDTIYECYCSLLLQQSLYIVCSDSHILTHTVTMLLSVFSWPFGYPHPCVSKVFDEDLLDTPFVTMLGLCCTAQEMEGYEKRLKNKWSTLLMIDMNGDTAKLRAPPTRKHPKSERLKRVFGNYYRQSGYQRPGTRQQHFTRDIVAAELQAARCLVSELQMFYREQLLRDMPNKEIIEAIHADNSNKHKDNSLNASLQTMKHVERYIKQKRPNRDDFLKAFTQSQIFSIYLLRQYGLM